MKNQRCICLLLLSFCLLGEPKRNCLGETQGAFIQDIVSVPCQKQFSQNFDLDWARNSASVPYSKEDDVLLKNPPSVSDSRYNNELVENSASVSSSNEYQEQLGNSASMCDDKEKTELQHENSKMVPHYVKDKELLGNSMGVTDSKENNELGISAYGLDSRDILLANVKDCQCGAKCSCPTSCSCRQKKSVLSPIPARDQSPPNQVCNNGDLGEPCICPPSCSRINYPSKPATGSCAKLKLESNPSVLERSIASRVTGINDVKCLIDIQSAGSIDKKNVALTDENTAELLNESNMGFSGKNTVGLANKNTVALRDKNADALTNENADLIDENTASLTDENRVNLTDENIDRLIDENISGLTLTNTEGLIDENTAGLINENTASLTEKSSLGLTDGNDEKITPSVSVPGNPLPMDDNLESTDVLNVEKDAAAVPTYNDEVFQRSSMKDKHHEDNRLAVGGKINEANTKNGALKKDAKTPSIRETEGVVPNALNTYNINPLKMFGSRYSNHENSVHGVESSKNSDETKSLEFRTNELPDSLQCLESRKVQSLKVSNVMNTLTPKTFKIKIKDISTTENSEIVELPRALDNRKDSMVRDSTNADYINMLPNENFLDITKVQNTNSINARGQPHIYSKKVDNTELSNELNNRKLESTQNLDSDSARMMDVGNSDFGNILKVRGFDSNINAHESTDTFDDKNSGTGVKFPATFRIVSPREYGITRSKINSFIDEYNEEIRSKRDLLDTMETIDPQEDTRQADSYGI